MSSPLTLNLCTVTLLGNLVGKPEIRYQVNPVIAIAELTLATHTRWLDKATNQYKEWTSYHTVKVIGDIVEQALIHASKGDVVLVHGYLLDSKKTARAIIHATFAQAFPKGYAQSINQVQCSGQLIAPVKLLKTEHNKDMAEINIVINHKVISPVTQNINTFTIERAIHVWGKQAVYLSEQAEAGDQIVVEGKLSYATHNKQQFIDSKQVVLLKNAKKDNDIGA